MNTNYETNKNVNAKKSTSSAMRIFRNRHLLVADVLIILACYFLSILMVYNIYETAAMFVGNILSFIFTSAVFVVCLYLFGLYTTMWVHSGTRDYIRMVEACIIASLVSVLGNVLIFPGFCGECGNTWFKDDCTRN